MNKLCPVDAPCQSNADWAWKKCGTWPERWYLTELVTGFESVATKKVSELAKRVLAKNQQEYVESLNVQIYNLCNSIIEDLKNENETFKSQIYRIDQKMETIQHKNANLTKKWKSSFVEWMLSTHKHIENKVEYCQKW